jgi:hypothetical protein
LTGRNGQLLAMQKVEGSSPFIRFRNRSTERFVRFWDRDPMLLRQYLVRPLAAFVLFVVGGATGGWGYCSGE